jgi:hypothetical protein
MRKNLITALVTVACGWVFLVLSNQALNTHTQKPSILTDIFQLSKPVHNFMSALIVDPTLGCDFNCDIQVQRAERIHHEKEKLENKKEEWIKKLKDERDSLEETVFKKAIGFHEDQLSRAIERAKSKLQHTAEISRRVYARKVSSVQTEN